MKNNTNLQLFAEPVPVEGVQQPQDKTHAEPNATEDTPIFSVEQQKYIDTLMAKSLEGLTKSTAKKVTAIEEAQKLAGMTAEQRAAAELETYKQRIATFEKNELTQQFKTELSAKGLPQKFAELLDVNNAEGAATAIDFLNSYKLELEKTYADKIKGLEDDLKNANLRNPAPKRFDSNVDPLVFNKQPVTNVQPWNAINHGNK